MYLNWYPAVNLQLSRDLISCFFFAQSAGEGNDDEEISQHCLLIVVGTMRSDSAFDNTCSVVD